uniref:SET domain-containing protein n=2 Tax=Odontella aurita TaxID=265563 RepID=A0A7S4J8V8_9STRA|mmetsp:Transcript_41658/g.126318  ORF Transcript_41658/g.126318 Transcript_41658/m.126318 type:complete len:283 (+) Transcript_41658:1050-1898(+)
MRVLNSHAASSREEAEGMHAAAVKDEFDSLPEVTRRAVLELSSCGKWNDADDAGGGGGGKVTPLGAYQTNSFRLEGGGGGGDGDGDGGGNNPDAAYGGLFLTIARINHSCRPNVCHMWRPDLRKMIVFACRDIAPGDEICTTYGPSECLDTEGRRAHLLEHFSFECTCDMCTEGNSNGGDDRMTELNSLQEDIAFLTASGKPQAAIRAVERCLSLLEEQGIGSGAFVKPILHYGYMISVAGLRDGAMARSYLVRELVAVKKCEGEDSPSALKIQQELDDMAA